jgi:CubicO group peptidase (beta-lactamase class C family)
LLLFVDQSPLLVDTASLVWKTLCSFVANHYKITIMKKQSIILAFVLWSTFSTAQQKTDPRLTANFDKILSEQFTENAPGAAILVARKGEVIYSKAFGKANLEQDVPMQTDQVFRIASITKQFTAVAILQLMEKGKLVLNDDITQYLPDYPVQGNKITIEHLLTHTSGIQDYAAMKNTTQRERLDVTPEEMIAYFKDQPMRFAPGTKWEYSNSNYFLLGYIIEKITGKTYGDYLQENFFGPLGMANSLYANDTKIIKNRASGYTQDDNGYQNAAPISMTHPYAAGAIQSTVGDLFKWQQAVQGYQLLKKETLSKAQARHLLADGTATSYGYGWRIGSVYEKQSLWHGGLIDGFKSVVLYLPEPEVFVAVLTNCDCSAPVEIGARLAALASGTPYEYTEIPIAGESLKQYAGVYENPKGQLRILSIADGTLYSQVGRGPKSKLKAYQKDGFFMDATTTVTFSRNKKGAIEKLITGKLTGNEAWNKTNKPIPSENGITVAATILADYIGSYEVNPQFGFAVTLKEGKLWLQADGQEPLELFAETETKFFVKVNDAQFEFIRGANGAVTKAILNQGGRQADAKKVK